MPYAPNTPNETDRSFVYHATWFGLAGSLITAANLFIGMDNMVSAISFGAMAGGPLSAALERRADEYYRSLANMGFRWMAVTLAAYLIALFIIANGDVASDLGFWFASGELPERASSTRLIATNGIVGATILSLAYYAGYTFAWARDQREA